MSGRARGVVSWLAGFAIAFHAILAGFALPVVATPLDPFSVICHSQAPGTPDDGKGSLPADQAPSQSCDHCQLCGATASPMPPDAVLESSLAPSTLLQVLYPVSTAPAGGSAVTPKLARGPPIFA